MAIVPLNHFPIAPLGMPRPNGFGALAITAFALMAISNLPKADALGHFWKFVDENCYEMCKNFHGAKGVALFGLCIAGKYLKK